MTFLVTVACAIGISCPLSVPYYSEFVAPSPQACHAKVEYLMRVYGQDPARFTIKCERK